MVNSDRVTAYFQTLSTLNRNITAQKSGAPKTGDNPENEHMNNMCAAISRK